MWSTLICILRAGITRLCLLWFPWATHSCQGKHLALGNLLDRRVVLMWPLQHRLWQTAPLILNDGSILLKKDTWAEWKGFMQHSKSVNVSPRASEQYLSVGHDAHTKFAAHHLLKSHWPVLLEVRRVTELQQHLTVAPGHEALSPLLLLLAMQRCPVCGWIFGPDFLSSWAHSTCWPGRKWLFLPIHRLICCSLTAELVQRSQENSRASTGEVVRVHEGEHLQLILVYKCFISIRAKRKLIKTIVDREGCTT